MSNRAGEEQVPVGTTMRPGPRNQSAQKTAPKTRSDSRLMVAEEEVMVMVDSIDGLHEA